MKFHSFVMFAAMRTGSNYLESNLNAIPAILCHGEVFNPAFVGKPSQSTLLGMDMPAREADPMRLLALLRETTEGLAGFRQFPDHDIRVTEAVLEDPGCAKIVLTRNPLESYVSLLIARETDQWKLTSARKLRTSKVRFDPEGFEAHLDDLRGFYSHIAHRLKVTGQSAFHLDYADLQDLQVLNGLAAFLGVEGRLEAPDGKLKKQNPEPILDKVENPVEMATALASIDTFGLSHIPNFEPGRGLRIPSLVAMQDVPLLFMPIAGACEGQVAGWMQAAGTVADRFDWRTFRRWRLSHAGFRSFSVLRHPLARAHDGFCRRILTAEMSEIRRALIRSYRIPLPDAGTPLDIDGHREAFLAFLKFLKLNLAGQTGLRVAGPFASQSAVLQGMAGFRSPDFLLREDRLEAGLAFLASEMGMQSPPLPAAEELAFPFAAFVDDEIEAAARDAYRRDYDTYGFADWREG